MSAFEFFFSFYGLLLGLSVAELVSGFSRVLHERERIRFGWLTPLLAVFVAIDIATFWNQAWVIFRGAPFNFALLVLGLVVAGTFYVAASVTFPRVAMEGRDVDLDDHFWAQRRIVFGCVLAANLLIALTFFAITGLSGEIANIPLTPIFWVGLAIFICGTSIGAFAGNRRLVIGALLVLVAYHLFTTARALNVVIQAGGWSLLQG